MRVQKSKIEWLDALDQLTPEAYYLLQTLYYRDIVDVKDSVVLRLVPYAERAYKKYKAELIDKGFMKVEQVGRHKYKYMIGQKTISKDSVKYGLKELIAEMLESRLMLEGRDLTEAEKKETRRDATEIHAAREQSIEFGEVKI